MAQIEVIHETPRVIVAGRNRCNAFNGNQFAIIAKATKRAVLVDMADDWADDWHMFLEQSGAELECIFFTHLHMDNLLGLQAFLRFRPDTPLAWCPAEQFWVDKWRKTCERYVRPDLGMFKLPFSPTMTPYSGDGSDHAPNIADVTGLTRIGKRGEQILLTQDSNRLSPTFTLSKDLHLFAVSTPGHSLGHQCLFLPHDRLLFTGDLIFNELIGRVDLPNACAGRMAQSLRMLEDFHDETVLLPGHGRMTTLGWERKKNFGLQRVYELMGAGIETPLVGANQGFF
jgi:glyoxylase-like metal-dependent hydrolase (beta-lactamase superfamily II)